MNGQDRAHVARPAFADTGLDGATERGDALGGHPLGGIVARAIRSHRLWLTLGYFAVLLLLARVYA